VSDLSTFPAEGANHLIIDGMAQDATLEGDPDATAIEATYLLTKSDVGPIFEAEGETAPIRC
jgi:hypothetical protein